MIKLSKSWNIRYGLSFQQLQPQGRATLPSSVHHHPPKAPPHQEHTSRRFLATTMRWSVAVMSLCVGCTFFIGIYFVSTSARISLVSSPTNRAAELEFYTQQLKNRKLDGYNASNRNKTDFRVPNILHYIHFGTKPLSFVNAMCIKAAYLRQNPDKMFIHIDASHPEKVLGPWWQKISHYKKLQISHLNRPKEIFGHRISVIQHASDVARLQMLMKYGGIYMDSDMLLLSSLNHLRIHDFSVSWPEETGAAIGNQLLMSTREAPFLHLYYDTYHDFQDGKWYYNAGELPTEALLRKMPQLVHRVSDSEVAVATAHAYTLYRANSKHVSWKAVHLLYGHRSYLFKNDYKKFPVYDETTIYKNNITFTRLMRVIYEAKILE